MVEISGHTRLACVLGWPIAHTYSPALHNAAYSKCEMDAVYIALPCKPEDFGKVVEALGHTGFMGANVTVPHKQIAFVHCDDLDDTANATGAVNTLVWNGHRLHGYNTDVDGFANSLVDAEVELESKGTALVLGSGGAARAGVHALVREGWTVRVLARSPQKAVYMAKLGAESVIPWTKEKMSTALYGIDLLVDATSMGLSPEREESIPAEIDLNLLSSGTTVMSMVYHRETKLLKEAKVAGLRTVNGEGMLVHQAAKAFEHMTGDAAPLDAMFAAFQKQLEP